MLKVRKEFGNKIRRAKMVKNHINPHQLVERLERNYHKRVRFQKLKDITSYFRRTVLHNLDEPTGRHDKEVSRSFLDYEYTF